MDCSLVGHLAEKTDEVMALGLEEKLVDLKERTTDCLSAASSVKKLDCLKERQME